MNMVGLFSSAPEKKDVACPKKADNAAGKDCKADFKGLLSAVRNKEDKESKPLFALNKGERQTAANQDVAKGEKEKAEESATLLGLGTSPQVQIKEEIAPDSLVGIEGLEAQIPGPEGAPDIIGAIGYGLESERNINSGGEQQAEILGSDVNIQINQKTENLQVPTNSVADEADKGFQDHLKAGTEQIKGEGDLKAFTEQSDPKSLATEGEAEKEVSQKAADSQAEAKGIAQQKDRAPEAEAEVKAKPDEKVYSKAPADENSSKIADTPAPGRVAAGEGPEKVKAPGRPEQTTFIQNLKDEMVAGIRANKNELYLKLKPDHLGGLSVLLQMTDKGLMAKMVTSSDQVERMINTNMQILQNDLKARGIEVAGMEVISEDVFSRSGNENKDKEPSAGENGYKGRGRQLHGLPIGLDLTDYPSMYGSSILEPGTSVVYSA